MAFLVMTKRQFDEIDFEKENLIQIFYLNKNYGCLTYNSGAVICPSILPGYVPATIQFKIRVKFLCFIGNRTHVEGEIREILSTITQSKFVSRISQYMTS